MSRSSQERTTEALAAVQPVEALTGQFVRADGAWAIVNQGTTSVRARSTSSLIPFPGEPVRLERRGGELVMLGPTVARPTIGRIVTAASPIAVVEYPPGSGVTREMIVNAAYTPALNDVVQLGWDTSGGVVLCKLAADPSGAAPVQNSGGGSGVQHPAPFTAIDSGSVRNSGGPWWTTSVRAGDPTSGAWFYGTKIRDTIPSTAVIQSARIYLPTPTVDEGYDTYLGQHASPTKPAADPITIFGSARMGTHAGWCDIPTSIVDFLKVTPGGIGLVPGLGFTWWPGVDADGMSGALDITYIG